MKRKASPVLIGAFVVAGLALLALVLITVAGGNLFARKGRAVMHFSDSVYGLQPGAPVVFRGVRVGSVVSIEVFYDRRSDSFSIPVLVELDNDAVSGLDGHRAEREVALALPGLIERGLSAQLAMQSLLTGLLYVDLDLRPQRGTTRGTYNGVVEIPTTATAIQALKSQLEGMDFRRLAEDLSAIAASAKAVVAGPELKQALQDLARITANVRHLSERLDRRVDPLADEMQRSLVAARSALDRVGGTADRLSRTSGHLDALLAPESPLVQNLQRTVEEVGRSAAALRQASSGDSALARGAERALADLSRAARALRDLAEALEQQPDALLRGRRAAE